MNNIFLYISWWVVFYVRQYFSYDYVPMNNKISKINSKCGWQLISTLFIIYELPIYRIVLTFPWKQQEMIVTKFNSWKLPLCQHRVMFAKFPNVTGPKLLPTKVARTHTYNVRQVNGSTCAILLLCAITPSRKPKLWVWNALKNSINLHFASSWLSCSWREFTVS